MCVAVFMFVVTLKCTGGSVIKLQLLFECGWSRIATSVIYCTGYKGMNTFPQHVPPVVYFTSLNFSESSELP